MSGRLLASRAAASQLRPHLRLPQALRLSPRSYSLLAPRANAAGLLRHQTYPRLRHESLTAQRFRSITQVPAVRLISFHRALPKLFVKFVRIPAAFGGATIAGLAYVNYQVHQAGNWTLGILNDGKEMASGFFNSGKEAFGGVVSSIEGIEKPGWLAKMQESVNKATSGLGAGAAGGDGSGEGGEGRKPEDEDPNTKKYAAQTAAATAAVLGYSGGEDDKQSARDDQMMVLTRKMIEIRTILQKVGQTGALTLPSIVVIGSQSSGKSSVLEAIVGHEFLPKGANMVTRRPIELTLVNTPDSNVEYGEFPTLNLGKITDFTHIQRTLTDLNLAVPEKDCVSDDPIRLTIYSRNVPDLSLIDLPGYIQLSALDQPDELKAKIFQLCDKYIQPPNVILAVSAADVDLANSTALRASRRVDPRGERTIGVITKMDLVDPDRGSNILRDKNYPLRLGYVGVVCKVPHSGGLFSRQVNVLNAITKNENAFFSQHPQFSGESGVTVGTYSLRRKLMEVLEATMAQSLQGTSDAIHQELEEASYEFKVQYNDRPLTADTYLAESLDSFKHSFKEFTEIFGRPQVRMLLKQELDQRVLDILAQRYWNKPFSDLKKARPDEHPLSELAKVEPEELYWHRKLDGSSSALTKLGIGRLATNVVANSLSTQMDQLIESSTFRNHPFAKKAIQDSTNQILNERFYATSDQVENCIKPYKFEIEVDDREWSNSRENAQRLLKDELKACEDAYKRLKDQIGGKKLSSAMAFVDKIRTGKAPEMQEGTEALGFSQAMLEKGREGIFLRDRADIIKMRMLAVKSKGCATKDNKYSCPEIFMDVVAEKLTSTAVLFLNVELLSEFYYNFPRELDLRLGRHLSQAQIEAFAREDPKIRKHVDLQQRKQLLELALQKMDSLMALEKSKKAQTDPDNGGRVQGRWGGLF
ncbi:dynamin-like GTPase mgm1 [Orbilia blumenaviensis]|uniref:dynamin GTPase n=1 Tax=Orbilia blumenaviensis TaxID=1796055 RepID=A0AAV9VLF3_9PEZI